MKCKNCGGTLIFHNDFYTCENCGLQQTVSVFFENTEVFECYIETDSQGRRSRDSIVAQDLYNKLENAKIHTFYQRISADGLNENDLETANTIAFDKAKIIAVIATTPVNFQKLCEKYWERIGTKKVIPIYSGIDANDMPTELKSLQAVNYDTVGATADFVKNILRLLDREQELNIAETAQKHMSRKKRTAIISAIVITALLLACASYFVFGTPYVLKSKKYEAAIQDLNNQIYIQAIEKFIQIKDYKDSSEQLKKIYNKYNGYYQNDANNISLHIDIRDSIKAIIEINKSSENGNIIINESTEIKGNVIAFSFNDNENNQGTVTCVLENDSIKLGIDTQNVRGKISIPHMDLTFNLNEKSDKPLTKQVDVQDIYNWLSKRYTKEQIEEEYNLLFNCGEKSTFYEWTKYNVENTNVYIDFFNFDAPEFIDGINHSQNLVDAEFAYAVSAPAEILIPSQIGKPCYPYIENNIIYVPNSLLYGYKQIGADFGIQNTELSNIENDTMVTCVSKKILGERSWEYFSEKAQEFQELHYSNS